jgi:hypothetical protein
MAATSRTEAILILIHRGRAQVHNAQLWAEWADPLTVFRTEPSDLTATLVLMQSQGHTHAWLCDSSYEPMPTAFRRMMAGQVWDKSKFTIFKTARPTFARLFYDQKLTAEHDMHDKFGGLRYVEIAALLDPETVFDQKCDGRDIDYLETIASKLSFPFSIFHLSSNEPLSIVTPSLDRVHRLYPSCRAYSSGDSILESHKTLALMSDSEMFFVLDADLMLESTLGIESFTFGDEAYVHIWYVRNPINGLVYGHGGPKAFNKDSFTELEAETVDVTTSANRLQLKVHEECVGVHRFNYSAESTWRTAFRESAKLTWLIGDSESHNEQVYDAGTRLIGWLNEEGYDTEQQFWAECLDGAHRGHSWAKLMKDLDQRRLINDFRWLNKQFNQYEKECKLEDVDREANIKGLQ